MAADLYVKEAEKSPLNAKEADSVLEAGDLVTLNSGGSVDVPDVVNGDSVDGVIPHRRRGPQIREHEEDYSPVQYEVGEGPVPFHMLESGMRLTRNALDAAAEVMMFEEVALDSNLDAVPASAAAAETSAIGSAQHYAASGESVTVVLDL